LAENADLLVPANQVLATAGQAVAVVAVALPVVGAGIRILAFSSGKYPISVSLALSLDVTELAALGAIALLPTAVILFLYIPALRKFGLTGYLHHRLQPFEADMDVLKAKIEAGIDLSDDDVRLVEQVKETLAPFDIEGLRPPIWARRLSGRSARPVQVLLGTLAVAMLIVGPLPAVLTAIVTPFALNISERAIRRTGKANLAVVWPGLATLLTLVILIGGLAGTVTFESAIYRFEPGGPTNGRYVEIGHRSDVRILVPCQSKGPKYVEVRDDAVQVVEVPALRRAAPLTSLWNMVRRDVRPHFGPSLAC
jgi:hypothetical protein